MKIQQDKIKCSLLERKGIALSLLRLDLIPGLWSGNKYFKLKYNLAEAKRQNKTTLLTFGGAYSNHIAATAAAGKEKGFKTIGLIRGEAHHILNPTLQFALDCGMQLQYVSREDYRKKHTLEFIHSFIPPADSNQDSEVYLLPEGGSNLLAVKGCREILTAAEEDFDYVCCSCGTGTTLAGIILSLKKNQKAIGFSSLKGGAFLVDEVQNYLNEYSVHYNPVRHLKDNWSINTDYHFGGYGKTNKALVSFSKNFQQQHAIELDYVYTAKMMYGIFDLADKNYFAEGSKIVAVHTGGLLGNAGFD